MNEVTGTITAEAVVLSLSGRIDSGNASRVQEMIHELLPAPLDKPVVLDMKELEYISSAGLRVLLHLKKACPALRLINVGSEAYEILDMTGFTQMMEVEKAYREVSIEGCQAIGRGANGTLYRIAPDTVVKVYNHPDALADIRHEREVAKLALILGIPTAISYDLVRVGERYGSVFELLRARSLSDILATEPEKLDDCVREFTGMLKKVHGTLVPAGKLPDMREKVLDWARFLQDYLPQEAGEKLLALVEAVPHDDHMLHGDYHTKNLMLQGDELLLIDMDTLSVGHPVFELGSMYNAFVGFSEYDHETVKRFQGFDYETSRTFWKKTLASYLGTEDPEAIRAVEDKARIIGYARLLRRAIRRHHLETEAGRAEIELWKSELLELLARTDTLLFTASELSLEATVENLPQLLSFLEQKLEAAGCPMKVQMQLSVAAEEIFVNIASYAYAPGTGTATVCLSIGGEPRRATLTFLDSGVPFDPLAKADPDVSLPAAEREIGGLGIYMTKKTMDDVHYEYRSGQNILTLVKFF